MLKVSPMGRDADLKTYASLLNRRVNYDLVQLIPSLQEALTQFVNIKYLPAINLSVTYLDSTVLSIYLNSWFDKVNIGALKGRNSDGNH